MKMKVPRLAGPGLTMMRIAAETPASSGLVRNLLKRQLGVDELAKIPESLRAALPLDVRPIRARRDVRPLSGDKPLPSSSARSGGWPRRAADYAASFAEGRTTPRHVADKAI